MANDAWARGDASTASRLNALVEKQNILDAQAAAGEITSQQYLHSSNQLLHEVYNTRLVPKPVAGKAPAVFESGIWTPATQQRRVESGVYTPATQQGRVESGVWTPATQQGRVGYVVATTPTWHGRVEGSVTTTSTQQRRFERGVWTRTTRKGRQDSSSESSSDEEDEEHENVDVIVPTALHSGGGRGSNVFRLNREESANEVRELAKMARKFPTFFREKLGRKVLEAYPSFKTSVYSFFCIRCVLINTQSITPKNKARRQEKLAALAALAVTHEVIIMTETWLKPIIDASQLRAVLAGFELFRHDRRNRRGGGVAIAVKHTVSPSRFRFSREASLPWEVIGLTLTKRGRSAKLLAVYRPPSSNISRDSLEFSDDLIMSAYEEFVGHNPGVPVVWVGDFKIDGVYFEQGEARLRAASGRPSSIMEAFVTDRELMHAVTSETHCRNYLDLVMYSAPQGVHTVWYSDSVFSAHKIVHFTIVPQ